MTNTPSLPSRIVAGLAIALIALASRRPRSGSCRRHLRPCAGRRAGRHDPSYFFAWSGTHARAFPGWPTLAFAWDGESTFTPASISSFARSTPNGSRGSHVSLPQQSARAGRPTGRASLSRAWATNAGVFVIPATGATNETRVRLFTQVSLMQPSWSPDGATLAYSAMDAEDRIECVC